MSSSLVLALIAALCGGGALLELAQLPLGRPRRRPGRERGTAGDIGAPADEPGTPMRWARPASADLAVDRLLDAAGRASIPDVAALDARRRLGALIGAAWGGAVGLLVATAPIALAVAALGFVGGRSLPTAMLRRSGRARQDRLADECPELLDLLAAAFGCGLPIRGALDSTGRWSSGELSAGVRRAATELSRGAAITPTLERFGREYPAPELQAAIAILARSRANGTPAAEPLRALAAAARHARARRAMEHAARAAPRVQLVSALLLVPAALCVLGAALVAGGAG